MIRPAVQAFVDAAPLPDSREANEDHLFELEKLLDAIERPVTTEEAAFLMQAFGPDDCFGLAWSLLHLIETAPESPLREAPPDDASEWVQRLWRSQERARERPPPS
jgi:hypothetical protein